MQPLTIEQVAALAWDLVKSDDDPLFQLCSTDHCSKLVYHAQSVKATGIASDDFERKVKDVLADPDAARLVLAEKWGKMEKAEAVDLQPLANEPEPAIEPVKTKRGKK